VEEQLSSSARGESEALKVSTFFRDVYRFVFA
jgi:hypothetical protein